MLFKEDLKGEELSRRSTAEKSKEIEPCESDLCGVTRILQMAQGRAMWLPSLNHEAF